MNKRVSLIFYFLFLIIQLSIANSINKNDILKRVNHLSQVESDALVDSIGNIINDLYLFDRPFGKKIIEQLLDSTKNRTPQIHLYCLNAYALFNNGQNLELLDSAYNFAHKHGIDSYDLNYFKNKSYYFRQVQKYDSSMVYILKARNVAKAEDIVSYFDISKQMGDLYYSVDLFDHAEAYYLLADSLLKYSGINPKWRTTVIQNNLGLIEFERGNYEKTISIYKKAMEAKPLLNNFEDSLAVSYYQRIIAECQFEMGNYKEAQKNIQFSFDVAKKYMVDDQLFASYLTLIRLLIETNNKAALIKYNEMFQTDFDCQKLPVKSQIECMLLNAEIWDYLNNIPKALDYYKTYIHLNDSFAIQVKTAGIIQLQTEQDYDKLDDYYQDVKSDRKYLLFIIALLLVFGIITYSRSVKISKLNQQLIASNNTKDKLFSIISHDLKAPFNSLLGFSDLLIESVKTKNKNEIEEFSHIINQTSSELFVLISNLLDWSQLQRTSIKLIKENVEIKKVLEEVIRILQSRAKAKNISIDFSQIENQIVYADRMSLITIFSNLISNAIKFTPQNGIITIETKEIKDSTIITVSDNGVGIPKTKIPHLFDVEYAKSTQGTNNEKGTGLGLIICKEFVEENSGEINVHSTEGKGTTFELIFNSRQL